MDQSGLLLLPDDALLAVLAYVAPRQLLDLRVLCRRLRDICLHPDLWRSVHLKPHLVLAALRLVPCLGGVTLGDSLLPQVASEISTCTCVIAYLDLFVEKEAELVSATAIAERVAALGGMRELHLYVNFRFVDFQAPLQLSPALVKMLYSTRQLRELSLELIQTSFVAPWRDFEETACLKSLSFRAEPCEGELLESLLRTHAATLENVELCYWRLPSSLKDLAKLQSLALFLTSNEGKKNDVSVLAEVADLETIQIFIPEPHCSPHVMDLLRRSSRLRSVTMELPTENPTAPLLALVASPSARRLQTLNLSFLRFILCRGNESCQKVSEELAAALPLFPSLKVLELGRVTPDIFQRVVSSTLAASLRTFRVRLWRHTAHHSLHDVNVQNLLARNPQLHFWPGPICFQGCHCQWCESGCHKELERFKSGEGPALASHAKRIGCPANCFQFDC